MNIYLVSGLGADEKAFSKLRFGSDCTVRAIHWITPQKEEGIRTYCERLADQIVTSERNVFIGLSFGGLIALELGMFLPCEKLILISSIRKQKDLPVLFRIAGICSLDKLLPMVMLRSHSRLIDRYFGVRSSQESTFLKNFLKNTSPEFLRWAFDILLRTDFNYPGNNKTVSIHGTGDKLLPYLASEIDYPIRDAGHFMVYNEAFRVNEILQAILQEL
jgi:pimeloyl-ACP methyl ester carboxylesterase